MEKCLFCLSNRLLDCIYIKTKNATGKSLSEVMVALKSRVMNLILEYLFYFHNSTSSSLYHQLLRFNKVRLAPVNPATNPLNRSVSVSVAAANQPKKPKVSFSRSISQRNGLDILFHDISKKLPFRVAIL